MKIGDVIRSTKIRPNETATIIKSEVRKKYNEKKGLTEIRTEYIARFKDKSTIKFYGFQINKTIFRVRDAAGQMRLEEFMEMGETQ